MSCKICYKGEIRRLAKQPQDFAELLKTVKDTFVTGLPSKFTLEYQDAEGDKIIIHNDEDYKLALESELSAKSLKIFLNDASDLENVSFIAKESIEDAPRQQEQSRITESDVKSFEILTEVKEDVAVEFKQLTVEIPSTRSHTVVEQSSQIPSAEDLLGSGVTVMSVQSGDRRRKMNKKVAMMQEIAQETILDKLPEMFTVFQEFLEESQIHKTHKSRAVHYGVECDGCGTFPVVGNRFKCTFLPDFDLCEECEAVVDHPYPLVKIVNESQYTYVHDFFAKEAIHCEQKQSKKSHKKQKKQKKNETKALVDQLLEHFEGMNAKEAKKFAKQASEIVNDFDNYQIEELVAEAEKEEVRKHKAQKKNIEDDTMVEDVINDVLQQLGGDANENIEYLAEIANTFAGEFEIAFEDLALVQQSAIAQKEIVSPSKKVSSKAIKKNVKDLAEIFPQADYEEIFEFVSGAPHKAFEDLVFDFVLAY